MVEGIRFLRLRDDSEYKNLEELCYRRLEFRDGDMIGNVKSIAIGR